MDWSNEQIKSMAGQTAEQAGERIIKMAKDAGLGPVKQHMLFEVARVTATLVALSTLLEHKHEDKEVAQGVSKTLSEGIPVNLIRAMVLGMINDNDLEALQAGPEKLSQLAQDAVGIMINELTGTLQSANIIRKLVEGKAP